MGPKSARPPNMNLSWLVTTSLVAHAATWVWSLLSLHTSRAIWYLVPLMVTPPLLLTYCTPALAACRNESPNEASGPPDSASKPTSIVLPLGAADEPPEEEPAAEEDPDDEHAARASTPAAANTATDLRAMTPLSLAFMLIPLSPCPAGRLSFPPSGQAGRLHRSKLFEFVQRARGPSRPGQLSPAGDLEDRVRVATRLAGWPAQARRGGRHLDRDARHRDLAGLWRDLGDAQPAAAYPRVRHQRGQAGDLVRAEPGGLQRGHPGGGRLAAEPLFEELAELFGAGRRVACLPVACLPVACLHR